MSEDEEFCCHLNYGPHHGTYKCMAHMCWEFWYFGKMTIWETFQRAELLGRTELWRQYNE